MARALSAVVALTIIGIVVFLLSKRNTVSEMPDFDYDRWWGDDSKQLRMDTSIRPFEVQFNDSMILDLKSRLSNLRPFTKPLEGVNFEYGTNTDYLQQILNYWNTQYDFKGRELLLNKYSHFITNIQGLDIHFVRHRPAKTEGLKVVPILMLHGWPSSSKEYFKAFPLLTTPRDGYDFVFDVIAVDLPGFGFSQGTNKRGLNTVQIGIIMRNLMKRLGYEKYYVHAGDWGAQCANHMATMFPDEILGYHSTFLFSSRKISYIKILLGSIVPGLFWESPEHLSRIYPLKESIRSMLRESGYFHKQGTKPDTVGIVLNSSPEALAGYILELMGTVTNRDRIDKPDGGLAALETDDILDTLTILWSTNCITTATRIYAEATWFQNNEIRILHEIPTYVPAASLHFYYEILYQPAEILRNKFSNLIHVTHHDFGGHYAAMEVPNDLVDDIFAATSKFIEFHRKNEIKTEL